VIIPSSGHTPATSGALLLPDYIGNGLLGRYDHDLILGDKEFERFDLRDLLDHQRRETVQFDIGRYFLASFGATFWTT
jgi:hypothetical protein